MDEREYGMSLKSIAANRYPEGLPGLLSMKEFCALIGVSRPTGLSIVREHPDYTVTRGNTQMLGVGLYQMLSRDESARLAPDAYNGPIGEVGEFDV